MSNTKIIGIDPAFRQKGIGFCELYGNQVTFKKYSINELLTEIVNGHFKNSIVCIEDSYIQNCSFDLTGKKAEIARKSRNVGMNQAVSSILCRCLEFRCLKLVRLSPREKGSKIDNTVVTDTCNRKKWVTNKKRTNQDDRDAFKLMEIDEKRYKYKMI